MRFWQIILIAISFTAMALVSCINLKEKADAVWDLKPKTYIQMPNGTLQRFKGPVNSLDEVRSCFDFDEIKKLREYRKRSEGG